MMGRRYLFLLKADLLRGRRLIPLLLTYTLLFLGAAFFITRFGSRILFEHQQFSDIHIAFYLPEGADYQELQQSVLDNLSNLRDGIYMDAVSSRDEGLALLENDEITVFLVFPDEFLAGLSHGDNKPVEIILKENNSLEEHIVTDLIISYADFLGTAESAAYSAFDTGAAAGWDADSLHKLERDVNLSNMSFVFSRSAFFREVPFDALTRYSLQKKLTASFLLMILMLTIFLFAWFVRGTSSTYCLRRSMQGMTRKGIFFSEYTVSTMLLYLVFLLIFCGILLTGLSPSLKTLWGIIPVVMLIALMNQGLVYLIKKPDVTAMAGLLLSVLLLYLAGGIIPMEFLPAFLSDSAKWNPFTYILRYVTELMF